VSEKLNESAFSKHSTIKSKKDDLNKSKDSMLSKDDYKYEIPDSCYLSLMKGNKVAKLHKKYVLVSHPFPKIEGELIVF
jgi:hypothetical protein